MKIRSIFFPLLFAAIASSAFIGCTGNQQDQNAGGHDGHDGHHAENHTPASGAMEATAPHFEVDDQFQDQLAVVFQSYVELKDAFVDSDVTQVRSEVSKTKDALGKVDMKLLSGAAHNDWMAFLTPIRGALDEIESGADIEAQRKAFSELSDNLYKSIKAFGLGGKEAYYEYCPMAFDDQGGYWLSDKQEIRNPYFGQKMISCGEVKEKLM